MPTWIRSPPQRKVQIAVGIARIHHRFTGAPIAFTQCVFRDLGPDEHFIGGNQLRGTECGSMGTSVPSGPIRPETHHGRDSGSLHPVLKIPESVVWVYPNELAHTDMIEFGRVLPEPGGEQCWLDQMSPELREHLVSLDHGAGV